MWLELMEKGNLMLYRDALSYYRRHDEQEQVHARLGQEFRDLLLSGGFLHIPGMHHLHGIL